VGHGSRSERRQEARELANPTPIPETWGEYLPKYGFTGDIAEAMAKVLAEAG
jgi:hypothetical protein